MTSGVWRFLQVLFGSTPTFPTIDRVWEVIERYRVSMKSCCMMSCDQQVSMYK